MQVDLHNAAHKVQQRLLKQKQGAKEIFLVQITPIYCMHIACTDFRWVRCPVL